MPINATLEMLIAELAFIMLQLHELLLYFIYRHVYNREKGRCYLTPPSLFLTNLPTLLIKLDHSTFLSSISQVMVEVIDFPST